MIIPARRKATLPLSATDPCVQRSIDLAAKVTNQSSQMGISATEASCRNHVSRDVCYLFLPTVDISFLDYSIQEKKDYLNMIYNEDRRC